jgi:RimJ/RimL family protein N-acetyltransferase
MSPRWTLRTARLLLTPVGGADLPDLIAIKANPQVFAVMLGGTRTPTQVQDELAREVVAWGAEGFGIWSIREIGGGPPGVSHARRPGFVGITGLERRADGRGVALRFALWPEAQGRGLAREAAVAALRFGHDEAGLDHIVAVARDSNFASRTVLGSIGMRECDRFVQHGWPMILYESRTHTPIPPHWRG